MNMLDGVSFSNPKYILKQFYLINRKHDYVIVYLLTKHHQTYFNYSLHSRCLLSNAV